MLFSSSEVATGSFRGKNFLLTQELSHDFTDGFPIVLSGLICRNNISGIRDLDTGTKRFWLKDNLFCLTSIYFIEKYYSP